KKGRKSSSPTIRFNFCCNKNTIRCNLLFNFYTLIYPVSNYFMNCKKYFCMIIFVKRKFENKTRSNESMTKIPSKVGNAQSYNSIATPITFGVSMRLTNYFKKSENKDLFVFEGKKNPLVSSNIIKRHYHMLHREIDGSLYKSSFVVSFLLFSKKEQRQLRIISRLERRKKTEQSLDEVNMPKSAEANVEKKEAKLWRLLSSPSLFHRYRLRVTGKISYRLFLFVFTFQLKYTTQISVAKTLEYFIITTMALYLLLSK
ncbi:hypothetical protein RFI_26411, partial [Reticulomyxa filosa]